MTVFEARQVLERAGYVLLDPGDVANLREFVDAGEPHVVLGYIESLLAPPVHQPEEG